MMKSNLEIEKYFSYTNLNFQKLIEFLPVGTIFFDDKWNIVIINSYAVSLLSFESKIEIPNNANIFYDNLLSATLPLNKILKLKDGISFEDNLEYIFAEKSEEQRYVVKGIPFISENIFKGGLLILQKQGEFPFEKKERSESPQFYLQNIIKQIYPCYVITDLYGKILVKSDEEYFRSNYYEIWKGQSIDEVFNNTQQTSIKQNIAQAITNRQNQFLELRFFSDTESFIFNTVIIPLLSEERENVNSLLFLFKEKNKVKNDSIDLLSNSKELNELRSFAISGYDAFFKTNLIGIVTFWSEKSENFFKKETNTVMGKKIEEVFPQLNKEIFEKLRNDLIKNKVLEGDLKYKYGESEFIVRTKVKLYKNDNLNEILFFCDKVDIQEQKLLQAKVEESNFFKDAILKSKEIILQVNSRGAILFANEKFCSLLEYDKDEIQGIYFLDLIEDSYRKENDISDFAGSVYKKSFETIPLHTKSGNIIKVNCKVNIALDGTNLKYFTIYLDEVNNNKQLQSEVSESLLNSFSNPVVLLSQNYVIKYNKKFEEIFNFFLDKPNNDFSTIISENSKSDFNQFINDNKIVSTLKPIKLKVNNDKETEVLLKKLNRGESSDNIVLEVLPVKKSELTSSEELNESKFTNFDQVIWKSKIEDDQIIIYSISDSIEKLTEYNKEYFFFSKTLWKDIIHPDDLEKVDSSIQNFIKNEDQFIKLQYRIIKKTGAVVWANNQIKKIRNDNGSINEVVGIITDVTEIVAKQDALNNRLNELEKLNVTKDKFISIISHDLKAPFTSIVGFAELGLTDTTLTIDELKEYIGYIKDASLHTLDLVNGLLDWTRIQTGRLQVTLKSVNAKFLAQKTTELLNGVAAQKGINLNLDVDEGIFIHADERVLTQVFNNLVSNALKFTPKNGRIDIIAKQLEDQNKVEFRVKDTGVGIEEEDLKKLFLVEEKFTTLGTEGERGTGLGLSLVKEIIEKHNGKIYVKSKVGEGSEFIFTIPMSTPSILIIDDKLSERLIYAKLIKSLTEGITIYSASDFEEARKVIQEHIPMVIISESEINKEKVTEFYESIGKTHPKYKPSFFILTRYMNDEDFEKCKTIGIDAIQPKPIEIKLLKTILDNLILGNN